MPSTSRAEASDQQREAEAYNYSIYLMVGMPYLLVAAVGFFVYRGLRRKAQAERAAARAAEGAAPPAGELRPATGTDGD